jgi:hypothetical protein
MGQIWEPMEWVPTHRGYWGGGVPMAYDGVERTAALYIEGNPQGGGMFHVKHCGLTGFVWIWYIWRISRELLWYLRPRGLFWTAAYGGGLSGYLRN